MLLGKQSRHCPVLFFHLLLLSIAAASVSAFVVPRQAHHPHPPGVPLRAAPTEAPALLPAPLRQLQCGEACAVERIRGDGTMRSSTILRLSEEPDVFLLRGFLGHDECESVITAAAEGRAMNRRGGGSSSSSNNSRDNLAVRNNPAYPSPRAPAPRHVSKMGGSELGQQLVVEIQQREALASQLTQLAEEVERTRAEGARQSAAALRLHQREAEATGSLRERLRIVETELVEARAFRANVERRMGGNVDGSGAAGFVGGGLGDGATAAVVAQLRLELDQEKERRVTDAAKVREAEAAAREVSARLAAQGEEFAAEMRRAGERVGALEEALTRERERANDVSRLEAETAGRLEGLRSLVDQRVEVSRNGTERNGLSVSLSTNR